MRALENKCQFSQNDILHSHEIFRILPFFFTILVKFDIYFLGLPREIVFGVITDNKFYL